MNFLIFFSFVKFENKLIHSKCSSCTNLNQTYSVNIDDLKWVCIFPLKPVLTDQKCEMSSVLPFFFSFMLRFPKKSFEQKQESKTYDSHMPLLTALASICYGHLYCQEVWVKNKLWTFFILLDNNGQWITCTAS